MINANYGAEWSVIEPSKDALPAAEEFREAKGKRDLLEPNPVTG